jgi:hypothetical protein
MKNRKPLSEVFDSSEVHDVTTCIEAMARVNYIDAEGRLQWITGKISRYTACDGEPIQDRSVLVNMETTEEGADGKNSQLQFPPEAAEAVAALLGGLVDAGRKFGALPPKAILEAEAGPTGLRLAR